MSRTDENLRWADRFEGAITRILARSFKVDRSRVSLPSDSEDKCRAKDFGVRLDGTERVVLARMRTVSQGRRYFDYDFTLRESFKKDELAVTEMEKVFLLGHGDVLFYGLDDGAYNVSAYRILRVSALRRDFVYNKAQHTVLSKGDGRIIGALQTNRGADDSLFWTFPLLEMPDDLDFKLPGSEPLPRKRDLVKDEQLRRLSLAQPRFFYLKS